MELEVIAKAFKELGHTTRLAIFKRLVKSGTQGVAVGVVQEELNIPGSTLSHHISSLASAGLISQRREGRVLFCVVEFVKLRGVINFLQLECCIDAQESCVQNQDVKKQDVKNQTATIEAKRC